VTRSVRLAVYGAAVLVPLLAVWFLVVSPHADAMARAEERTGAAVDRAALLRTRVAMVERYLDEGEAAGVQLERLRSELPDDESIPAFVLLVDQAARESGALLRSLEPGAEDAGPAGTRSTSVSMAAVGTADAIDAFLRKLVEAPRAIVVDDVQLSQDDPGRWSISMRARIFSAGEGFPLGAPAPAPAPAPGG